MNASQLVPASQLARGLGVKVLAYGKPGTRKTPAIATAPRPVLLACEPGLRSMAKASTPTWEGYTEDRINEFLRWLHESQEAAAFDTVCIDSVSQMAETVLYRCIRQYKHGKQAFGEMAKAVYDHLCALYFMRNKHVYLIAKEGSLETTSFGPAMFPGGPPSENVTAYARPYFPGQQLNIVVPHLFDEILHSETFKHTDGQMYTAFRARANDFCLARDRSGNLAEREPMDLTALFAKCML